MDKSNTEKHRWTRRQKGRDMHMDIKCERWKETDEYGEKQIDTHIQTN